LQVDDLARLVDRKGRSVVIGRVSVGADEAMLLALAADLALDRARRLIMTIVLERRGANDKAFIFDRIGRLGRFGAVRQSLGGCGPPASGRW